MSSTYYPSGIAAGDDAAGVASGTVLSTEASTLGVVSGAASEPVAPASVPVAGVRSLSLHAAKSDVAVSSVNKTDRRQVDFDMIIFRSE